MNLINEEIMAIRLYMDHLSRAIPLAVDTGERIRMKEKYKELEELLNDKLEQSDMG